MRLKLSLDHDYTKYQGYKVCAINALYDLKEIYDNSPDEFDMLLGSVGKSGSVNSHIIYIIIPNSMEEMINYINKSSEVVGKSNTSPLTRMVHSYYNPDDCIKHPNREYRVRDGTYDRRMSRLEHSLDKLIRMKSSMKSTNSKENSCP